MPSRVGLELGVGALCVLVLGAVFAPAPASAIPVLWGIDEDDGTLFSLQNYTAIGGGDPGLVVYGELKFEDEDGRVRNLGRHIEAFGLGPDGIAYFAINASVGDVEEPVLLRFDTKQASTTEWNVADLVARIPIENFGGRDNITGLSFGPDGWLYGLYRKGDDG